MKLIILLSFLFIASCGSHKINNQVSERNDAFSDESFMRFGSIRLSEVSDKNTLNKALSKCYSGNFNNGLGELQRKISSERDNTKYWLYIGICYQLYGSQLKANFFYDYALSGDNTTKSAIFNNKALTALKANNYEDAHTLLLKAINLSPKANVPKYNLAQLYIKFNHLDKARELITPLISNNPNDIDLILSIMTIDLADGNLQKAESWARKFSATDLKREDISLYVALVHYELNLYKKAKEIIGGQRATIIDEIKSATEALTKKIDLELEKIKLEKDSKDASVSKGVSSVAVKN